MNEKYIEVLQQYDLELISARKGRGAWLCETNQGLKLVREYKGTMKRLEFEEVGESLRCVYPDHLIFDPSFFCDDFEGTGCPD